MEKQPNIIYRALAFIAYSNIFISLCTASLAAYTLSFFSVEIDPVLVWMTFGTTFILYNTQQLLLGYLAIKDTDERKKWHAKNKVLLALMGLTALGEVYPVFTSSVLFVSVYGVALVISLLYFLPFTNLRSIPFLKSLIVGTVWMLVCVVAPLAGSEVTYTKINFSLAQLFFITALCVLFNIRDMDQDKMTRTYTIPVLYGITAARMFAYILLAAYMITCYITYTDRRFLAVSLYTFLLSCYFASRSHPQKHPFYYLFGVDGLIMVQSVLGLLFLR